MSNMNFNCDVCGREVQGCTLVNGMKFCAKCYQETFGETEKDRKINDLQSQLAEKDKEIEELKMYKKGAYEKYIHKCEYLQGQIKDLYKKQNQKAIEQLEKVKEKINDCPITDYDTNKHFVKMYQSDAIRQLDNQIKQLKEQ